MPVIFAILRDLAARWTHQPVTFQGQGRAPVAPHVVKFNGAFYMGGNDVGNRTPGVPDDLGVQTHHLHPELLGKQRGDRRLARAAIADQHQIHRGPPRCSSTTARIAARGALRPVHSSN